jgi:cellulose synthase/poly-beta-1,6-N-acetylglucosamine synthase-like glycosyltransferase
MDLINEVIKIMSFIIGSLFFLSSIFYLFTVWNVKKPVFNYEYFPKVSIMAYAWQSGNVIERKIKNFLDQNYPKDRFEIIIYDNKSTDETDDICIEYERKGLIKFYQSQRIHDRKAPVLDHAIEKVANGEIIALTDPDGICENNWLKKIVLPFKDPEVGAVAGITHCGNYYKNLFTKFRAIEDEWWYNISVLGKTGKIKISNLQPICGANYALRKKAWESIGKSHGDTLIEDYEMTFKLYNKGWKISASDANVWQEEVENINQYVRQRLRWYSSSLKEIVKGKGKIDKILGGFPISMQPIALLSLIYFLLILAYTGITKTLSIWTTIFATPFLLTYIALALGLVKVGKAKLLPYIPLFLTFDSALQLIIFLETKIRFDKERKWIKLVKGKYYHSGTMIRVD